MKLAIWSELINPANISMDTRLSYSLFCNCNVLLGEKLASSQF